jgi:hypothetical protein
VAHVARSLKTSLLFMHVPKTGGAALTGVLANRFATGDCLELYFGPEPDLSEVDRYRYVSGHIDASFIQRFARPPFVLTLLRDPIDRALSTYSFTRSFPAHYELPQTVRAGRAGGEEGSTIAREWWRLVPEYDLGELISRAPEVAGHILGNRQARALCACPPGEERLADAIAALEQCDFVGLTDRLDESLEWLTRRLGWRDLSPLPRSNVSGARLRREEIGTETMDALAKLTEVDRELYLRGVERYERQLEKWVASPDPRDPSVRISDASPVSDLPFDQAILGGGWMNREPADDGSTFCWIGSTRRAWVEMIVERGMGSLDIEIPHALDQEVLEGLRVAIDDRVIPHTLAESGGGVVATVPLRHRLRRRRVTVSIEVDRSGHPQEVNPESSDHRELAIAVRRMTFRPA